MIELIAAESLEKIPVCGCYYYNLPSKKTLEKVGFLSKHRVIKFQL